MLLINYNQGIFEIEGDLASENSKSLRLHFESMFKKDSKIVLSLDKLNRIDTSGVNCIVDLYKKAAKKNKVFYVIGKTNKRIAKALKETRLSYIVRNDFL